MIPPEIGVSSQPGQILEVPIKKGVMDSPFFAPKDKNGIFIAASPCKARVWSAGLADHAWTIREWLIFPVVDTSHWSMADDHKAMKDKVNSAKTPLGY